MTKAKRIRQLAVRLGRLVGVALLGGALVATALTLPGDPRSLASEIEGRMEVSGVDHPVTAVLLNFRAYDTWLELAVLLLAAVLVLGLRRADDLSGVEPLPPASAVLVAATRLVIPVVVLTATYLLWLGTHAPGGAFQAGAVLGAGGVLLHEAGLRGVTAVPGRWLRGGLLAGFAAFTVAAAVPLAIGGSLFEHPADRAGVVIVAVETAAGVTIGLTLAVLFAASQTRQPAGPGEREVPRR
jgi:multisubunit Na+/H+ antiporter MnhB subunit